MLKVAVLVSGGGSNLQALINAENRGELAPAKLTMVISNNANAYALERAKKHGLNILVLPRASSTALYAEQLLKVLNKNQIDLVVLAGFMVVLDEKVTNAYKDRIINIHPSLIPSFAGVGYYGLRVHKAALERGVHITGATVHLVNEVVDGGKILMQKAVQVMPNDTPEILQKRVMEEAEWIILPKAVKNYAKQWEYDKQRQIGGNIVSQNLYSLVKENSYPGRGIVIGQNDTHALIAYFIMGRSENSRNRIFVAKDNGLITQAFDESKCTDPSLIIYAPVRVVNENTIVTNGDQTDTVFSSISEGKSFEDALRTRTFEPDAPNYTPRISGMVTVKDNKMTYKLSILKSAMGNPESVQRFFYEYTPVKGEGHFIHTYEQDGDPIPSFKGEPKTVVMQDNLDAFTEKLWANLNNENKVSLFTRSICLKTGEVQTRILNKNEKEV